MTRRTDIERIERAVSALEQTQQEFSSSVIAQQLGIIPKQVSGYLRGREGVYLKKKGNSQRQGGASSSIWAFGKAVA